MFFIIKFSRFDDMRGVGEGEQREQREQGGQGGQGEMRK